MNYQRAKSNRLAFPSGMKLAINATMENTSEKNASAKKGLKTSIISQVIGANYTGDRR